MYKKFLLEAIFDDLLIYNTMQNFHIYKNNLTFNLRNTGKVLNEKIKWAICSHLLTPASEDWYEQSARMVQFP